MPQPANSQTKINPIRRIAAYLMVVLSFAALWFALSHWQQILDWSKLYNYEAPAAISQIADQTTMTDEGRHLFYINHPKLETKATFYKYCPKNGGEQTIVLGCYRSPQQGIYLLDVNDARLTGVEQVTAAHEMLHSAYDRLSEAERERVDTLLQDYFDEGLADERVRAVVNSYRETEPNDLRNEMHSIFASEVANLPTELEEYYKQYFKNRRTVTDLAAQYQSEFTSREDAVKQYDTELESLKAQIESTEAAMDAGRADIDAQEAQLNALRGQNVAAYNAAVPGFNRTVDAYNAQLVQLRGLIERFNQAVAARNDVALEQNELAQELSTDATPIAEN